MPLQFLQTHNQKSKELICKKSQEDITKKYFDSLKQSQFPIVHEIGGDDHGHHEICLIRGLKEKESNPHFIVDLIGKNPNDVGEGINVLELRNTLGPSQFVSDPPSIKNICGILSPSESDQTVTYEEGSPRLTVFSQLTDIFRFLILVSMFNFLIVNVGSFLECLPFPNSSAECPQTLFVNLFMTMGLVPTTVIIIYEFYDLTAVVFANVGFSPYSERIKGRVWYYQIDSQGHFGQLFFRILCYLTVMLVSSYNSAGNRSNYNLFDASFFSNLNSQQNFLHYIVAIILSPKMLLLYSILLVIFSCLCRKTPIPWFDTLKTEDVYNGVTSEVENGSLTKLSTLILTTNTLFLCSLIALILNQANKSAIESPSTDPVEILLKIQFYLLAVICIFSVTFKIINASLSRKKPENVSIFYLMYIGFTTIFTAVAGLENIDSSLISYYLLFCWLLMIIINLAYLAITYFVETLSKTIQFALNCMLKTKNISLILNILIAVFVFFGNFNVIKSITISWFTLTYRYCSGTNGMSQIPLLEKIPQIDKIGTEYNIQTVFFVVPLISSVLVIFYIVIERKFNCYKDSLLWYNLCLLCVNLANYWSLVFLQNVFDNLDSVGFTMIELNDDLMIHVEVGSVYIMIAILIQIIMCLIARANINEQYKPIRNPVFVASKASLPKSSFDVNVSNLQRETQKLDLKLPEKSRPSFVIIFLITITYLLFSLATYSKAHKSHWIIVSPNLHEDYLGKRDLMDKKPKECKVNDYSKIIPTTETFVGTMKSLADDVETIDLVSKHTIPKILFWIPLSATLTLICLCIELNAPTMIQASNTLIFFLPITFPPFLFIIFLPNLINNGVLSLIMTVRVESGLRTAFVLFFGHIFFNTFILVERMFPLASPLVDEAELKIARDEELEEGDEKKFI